MSGHALTEKADGSRFSIFVSRLKGKTKRHTSVPNQLIKKIERPQKSITDTLSPSNTSDAPKPSAINAKRDPPENAASSKSTSNPDLWQEAFQKLDDKEKNILGIEFTESGGALTLIDTVRARESDIKNESAKLKIGDDEILWRDCAARVVGWLTSLGDIAITFAPNPASVIWSGLKILLKAEVDRCEYLVAILKCAETVLPLVRRGAIYEKVYLEEVPEEMPESARLLKEALCNAYIEALKLMARVKSDLNKNAGQQFLNAILHPGQDAELVKGLTEAEARIGRDVQACEAEQRRMENKLSGELLRSLEAPLRHTQVSLDAILESLSEDERSRMLDALSRVQVGDQHRRRKEHRVARTGEWILGHHLFQTWENSSSSSILWLAGPVGSGKSVLASTIVDRYLIEDTSSSKQNDEGLAYFYYSKNDQEISKGDPAPYILGSFLRQLATVPRYEGKPFKSLVKLYKDMKERMVTFDVKGFETNILDLVNQLPRTFLVLDGLDEFEKPEDLTYIIQYLIGLVEASERPVKVFLSSRNETHIRDQLDAARHNVAQVHFVDENQRDIEKYVQKRINYIGNIRYWDEELREEVKSRLCKEARGMFRWVYLQTEQLSNIYSPDDVRKRLGRLPQGLKAAYDELYSNHSDGDQRILDRAIMWVMFSRVSVSTEMLLSAVQFAVNSDTGELMSTSRLPEEALINICRHLIVKDKSGIGGEWRFPHASVEEYFKDHGTWSLHESQIEFAELVLLLLIKRFRNFHLPQCDSKAELLTWATEVDKATSDPINDLLCYASVHWLRHVRDVQRRKDERKGLSLILNHFMFAQGNLSRSSLEYQAWAGYYGLKVQHGKPSSEEFSQTIAAHLQPTDNPAFGILVLGVDDLLTPLAEECFEQSLAKTNHRDLDLLSLAAKYGRKDVLGRLVAIGMDVNRPSSGGSSPLREAAINLQTDCAKVLLENGAMPYTKTRQDFLLVAVPWWLQDFNPEIPNLLLKYGGKVDALTSPEERTWDMYGCALEIAAAMDSAYWGTARCRWLVDAGATVNLQTQSQFGSPIVAAAYYGSCEVMEYLCSRGADVNMHAGTGIYGGVLAAAFCGYRPNVMIPYLIEKIKVEPKRLVSDLSTRDPPDLLARDPPGYSWIGPPTETDKAKKRAEVAAYLVLHKHVTIADLRKLAANSEGRRLVLPTRFLACLERFAPLDKE